MAHVPGITKEETLRRIAQHEQGFCQIDLGSPRRNSVIIYDGTEWRFSTMETDPDEEDALFQERISEGKMFLPEDVIKLQKEALCLVRCIDKRSFMVLIEGLPWEFGGPELGLLAKSFIFEDIEEKPAITEEELAYIAHAEIALHIKRGSVQKIIHRQQKRIEEDTHLRLTTESHGQHQEYLFKGKSYLSTSIEELYQERARLVLLRRAIESAEKELQSVIDAKESS